jgi:hypothetical protein
VRSPEQNREVFRLAPPVVLWWVWVAFAVANVADFAVQGASARFAVVVSVILVTLTGLAYALALRPRVIAGAAGLTVVNPFRDHHVPWTAIQAVDTAEWVRVHYAPAGSPTSAASKSVWCWALYVSSRSRRRISASGRRAAPAGPPGFARPAARGPRGTRGPQLLSGMMTAARREPGYAETSRLPEEGKYLASLPAVKAIAVRLDSRAARERSRAGPDAPPGPVTARWAWPPFAAVALPALALLIVALAA